MAKKTNFYTDSGWAGEKYDDALTIKEIAKLVRAELRARFPDCKFSVKTEYFSMGSAIHVSLMAAPFRALADEAKTHTQVSNHGINEDARLTTDAKTVMVKVGKIVNGYNYDDSDSMVDYFDTNFYFHLNIGKWDRPFEIKAAKKKVSKITPVHKPGERRLRS